MENKTINLATEEDKGITQAEPQAQKLGIDIMATSEASAHIQNKEFNKSITDVANIKAEFAPEDTKKAKGRPKAEVDEELLFKLAECHCNLNEIAYILGVTTNTIKNRFQHVYDRGAAAGKMRLRKAQYHKAIEGNPVMLIWLGKNILGQKDDPSTGEEDLPLPWTD